MLYARALTWAARFIQLQLFLTVFSLPMLIAWGLPISLLSPIGNLIFGPVLTLFLFFSSLIFFCQLVHVPHAWLVQGLEYLTRAWLYVMHNDAKTWLIGFVQPSSWFLLSISIASLLVLLCTVTNTPRRSIACWSGLFLLLITYSAITRWTTPTIAHLPCNNGEVTILYADKKVILIDPGYMGQRISAPSWAQYTLMPHVISTYGIATIDTIITLQNNSMTLEALERLCTTAGGISTIYLPRFDYPLTPSLQRKLKHLKITAYYKGIVLKYIDNNSRPISISNRKTIIAHPRFKTKKGQEKREFEAIDLQIDNENIPIYAARYAKKNKPSSDKTILMHETVVRAGNDHEKGSFGHSKSRVSTS